MMAFPTDLQALTMTSVKKSLLDLPSETIALVFENVGATAITDMLDSPDTASRQQITSSHNYVESPRPSESWLQLNFTTT